MIRLRLLLIAAALCPSVGCESFRDAITKINKNRDGDLKNRELREVPAETLVRYLNDHADRLQSITQADVLVTPRERNLPMPSLRGTLVASQPRNFRMIGDTMAAAAKVDLGSNDQQFWVYAKVPANDAMFVFASHDDFEHGRARIPGGIPFEPEWVMQAFGMAHFPPTNQYSSKLNVRDGTYHLSWPAVTPTGVSVVKEVVFNGNDVTGNKPQVKKHIVHDTKGKVICFAEIKEAKTVPVSAPGPQGGQALTVQYPTRVLLRWEEQKFEMELELRNAKINQPPTPEETGRYFSRPNIPGATPINLARHDELLK